MDFSGMDGPITFNREVRKQVFEFFSSILHNYPDPVYYECIRGHVSKATLPVIKYVRLKCKGEKLLEYFKLRKNYFTVEGTDVLLIREPKPKRKRVQSECVSGGVGRGRKLSWRSDRARSFSCSSTVSSDTAASSFVSNSDTGKKLEHEDYVNKFFHDLVIRNEKVDLSSLEFDNLPKKVKRHLDLYYKKKVANYFAQFPDKYTIDDDWKVSLNLHLPEDSFAISETKSVDTKSTTNDSSLILSDKKSPDPIDREIMVVLLQTEAILFFIDILTKKKIAVTVQQLGGYLSQASKELRSFFKFNYKNFKSFFEENSFIFLLNSCEEVTLSNFSHYYISGFQRIRKIATKAYIGDISLQVMKEKVEELINKMKMLFSDKESDKNIESSCEVIAEAQPKVIAEPQPKVIAEPQPKVIEEPQPKVISEVQSEVIDETLPNVISEAQPDNTMQQITENQPEPLTCSKIIEVGSDKPNCLDKKDEQIEAATSKTEANGLAELEITVPLIIEKFKTYYENLGSTDGILFEVNNNLYEPNGNLYKANFDSCTKDTEEVNPNMMIVKISARLCKEHMTRISVNSNTDCESVKFYEGKSFKFLLMVELFCLEMTEKDFDFTVSHEVKAIQYFIEILDQPFLKSWNVSSLHGTLGNASVEVSSFINKKYKVNNFLSFFQKQPEFEVYPPIIKLSASYKEVFARRIEALSRTVNNANRNSKWDLIKLYESSCYKTILKDTFLLFCEICDFLKKKSRTKLSRLEGILAHFPNCLDWIKALEGETVAKKIGCFLNCFGIFDFSSDNYISFQLNSFNSFLKICLENAHKYFDCPNNHTDLMSTFLGLCNQAIEKPVDEKSDGKVEQLICNFIIKDILPLKYHELAETLPEYLLMKIIESGMGSRTVIDALLKNGQYFLQNGKIDLKTDENNTVDNSLIKNQELKSRQEVPNVSDKVASKTFNGSLVSNNQLSEKTNQEYYKDTNSTSSFNSSSINENTLCEPTPINISTSVKSQIDLNGCNQNKFKVLDSECCVNDNSRITIPKEIKEIASTGCEEDFKNAPLYEGTDQTNSTASVKDCIETLNEDSTKNLDSSFDVVRYETYNQVPHHNMIEREEEFNSSVEEIDSLIALGERHSLSNYENEELFYSDEENSHDSIEQEENKCVVDTRYKENYISSQCVDIDANIKDTESVKMEKYLELLKIDDEVLEDTKTETNTKQKDTSSDINTLNEAFAVSEVSITSNLIYSESKTELHDEPKVADAPKNANDQTDFNKGTENRNISENLSEMKYKAKLLAKELFQNKFHEIVRCKIFIASPEILFEFTEKNISETIPNPIEIPIPLQNSNHLPNLSPTADKGNHNEEIPLKNTLKDNSVSTNNATVNTEFNLGNGKKVFEEFNYVNSKEKSASISSNTDNECHADYPHLEEINSKNNLNPSESSELNDLQSIPDKYPLQPISAEIVLLTTDSCIAVADVDSRNQNIYFLKCVFVCDDQYCCSNCFNDLRIGDIVSCFVPPTEISRRMWIAFMVSKETGSHFDEIDSFNEVYAKHNKGGSTHHNLCVNSKNVSIQTEHSSAELGCQVECMSTEKASQTPLSGDVKLCATTKDSTCQINPLVKSETIQTVNEINSSECQTESIGKIDIESQTNHTGELKEVSTCAEMSCQTDLSGEVRAIINVVETECQTISTGQVMITKYYHL